MALISITDTRVEGKSPKYKLDDLDLVLISPTEFSTKNDSLVKTELCVYVYL